MIRSDRGPLTYFQFERLTHFKNVVHAVVGRRGGVSDAPFDSLNVSFAVGDNPESVRQNRRLLCDSLSIPYTSLVVTKQVHGTDVIVLDGTHHPSDPDEWYSLLPPADGMITREPDCYPMMTFADCVPLILYDPGARAVGISHGGWKGTVAGIAGRTVAAMSRAFGSKPKNLLVGIGPAIGPCCYEVKEDVAHAVHQAGVDPAGLLLSMPDGTIHLDLWEMNRRQFVAAGVPAENIEVARLCTGCNTDILFSNRIERGRTGRFGAIVGLRH